MSDTLTALASENLNPSLRSLLEDVQRGHIRVPRFQRPFVWTDAQRLELLESVRDNMPIGSLLVWRTIKFKLASFDIVGSHPIPPIAELAPATGWQYLLDGHQRVSTLLGLLLPNQEFASEPPVEDEPIDWDIQYDLMEEDFLFVGKIRRKGPERPLLPLWTLFDGRMVNRQMRDIRKRAEAEGWTDKDLDIWEERADQLSYRFQQCRVPIVVMVTDDLKLAAKTFQRINSLGTPMGEAHLVAALTWGADFDLRERLAELREQLPIGWRDIDDSIFLQVCKGLSGLDITKAGQNELVKKLTEDQSLLERAGTGLARAVEWLSKNVGVTHQEILPYAFQAVLLAVEMANSDPENLPDKAMKAWFWRTSWSEVFSSASYRQVRSEQIHLREAISGVNNAKWVRDRHPPERFDFRSARVCLFTLRLLGRPGLSDETGNPINGYDLLARHGRKALIPLFSPSRNASPLLKRLLQGIGNRFFIDPAKDSILRERLRHGPNLPASALKAHFISQNALDALRTGNLEQFIQLRAEAMQNWDKEEWKQCECSSLESSHLMLPYQE